MVYLLGMYFASGQNMLTKNSLNIGVYFFLHNKISRVSLLVVLVYLLKTQLGSFFLSVLSSQNVGFSFPCLSHDHKMSVADIAIRSAWQTEGSSEE